MIIPKKIDGELKWEFYLDIYICQVVQKGVKTCKSNRFEFLLYRFEIRKSLILLINQNYF